MGHTLPFVIDVRTLGGRLADLLQARGLASTEQVGIAAAHEREGALLSTAFLRAGVSADAVLAGLVELTGVPAAPPREAWRIEVRQHLPFADDVWRRARAVPIGVRDGTLFVAFADPAALGPAAGAIGPHAALLALEDDVDAVLRGGGATQLLHGGLAAAEQPRRRTATESGAPADALPVIAGPAPAAGSGETLAARPEGREFGRFLVDKVLGRGGMATVYLAHDANGAAAAIKVIHAHLLGVNEARQRFLREARATQRLKHPNVVDVLEVGESPQAFLAVEFLEGGTVGDLLRRHTRLPLVVVVDIAAQVLAGLVAAHGEGIVHRDLKPENLLLSTSGVVKIADFGIARDLSATAMTQTGSTVGTPGYMSPEQARAQDIDGRTDLWALGVVVLELLRGKNVFEADSLGATVANVLSLEVPRPSERDPTLPEGIDELCAWLLTRKLENRAPDARSVLQRMAPLVDEIHAQRPHLLRDFLLDPGLAGVLERERAKALADAGRQVLSLGAAHREAAALLLFKATMIDPEEPSARALLAEVQSSLGGRPDVDGGRKARAKDLEAQLASLPDDPVLLMRAAQSSRSDGDLVAAVAFFRRYLNVRPDDLHARGQLERLTGTGVASTMTRVAGHIVTGGFVAPALSPIERPPVSSSPPPAPPPGLEIEAGIVSQAHAALSTHKGWLLAVAFLVLLIAAVVKTTGSFIKASVDATAPRTRASLVQAGATAAADEVEPLLTQAREAFDAANYPAARDAASQALEKNPRASQSSRAFLLRARAALAEHKTLAGVADLSKVIDGSDEADVVSEALALRGRAYAAGGDLDNALKDLDRCLDKGPSQGLRAAASLDRGLVKQRRGDGEGARSDLKWALDYTPPQSPIHQQALAALGPNPTP